MRRVGSGEPRSEMLWSHVEGCFGKALYRALSSDWAYLVQVLGLVVRPGHGRQCSGQGS